MQKMLHIFASPVWNFGVEMGVTHRRKTWKIGAHRVHGKLLYYYCRVSVAKKIEKICKKTIDNWKLGSIIEAETNKQPFENTP